MRPTQEQPFVAAQDKGAHEGRPIPILPILPIHVGLSDL